MVGAGYSLNNLMNSGFFSQPPTTRPSYGVRGIVEKYSSAPVMPKRILEGLREIREKGSLFSTDIREMWREAAEVGDPLGVHSSEVYNRMMGMKSGEMFRDLEYTLAHTESPYLQKTASIFLSNAQKMARYAEAGIEKGNYPNLELADLSGKYQIEKLNMGKGVNIHIGNELGERALADLQEIQKMLGASSMQVRRYGRIDMVGGELSAQFTVPEGGKVESGLYKLRMPDIPNPQTPEIVTRGYTGQSRYIAGLHGIVEGKEVTQSFNHPQWMINRMKEELVPQLLRDRVTQGRKVNTAIREFSQEMNKSLSLVSSIPKGYHAGADSFEAMRKNIMHLYRYTDPTEKGPVERIVGESLYKTLADDVKWQGQSLHAGHSAQQAASGIVSTIDTRGLASLVGSSEVSGRRPMKYLRPDFAPTAKGLEMIEKSSVHQAFKWAAARIGPESPMLHTAYAIPHADVLESMGVTSKGMGLILKSAVPEQERVKTIEILTSKAGADFQSAVDWAHSEDVLPKGSFLGTDVTGERIVTESDLRMVGADVFEDINKGKFMRFTALETVPTTPFIKSELGAKQMASLVGREYLSEVAGRIGASPQVQAITTADVLMKDPARMYDQLFTALWNFTSDNMNSGKRMSTLASNFAEDPYPLIQGMEDIATSEGKFHDSRMFRWAGRVARGAGFNPEQYAKTFGLMPRVFGSGWEGMIGKISPEAREAILSAKSVEGAAQMYYAGSGGPSFGRRGTIEPRLMETLSSPQMGELGPKVRSEVIERMATSYPERFREMDVLREARESILNLRKIQGAVSPLEMMSGISEGTGLPATSSALRISGFGDVQIPAENVIRQLTSRSTGESTIFSPLATAYRDVIEQAAAWEKRDIDQGTMQRSLDELAAQIGTEEIKTITGKGGLLRKSRLAGSRYLTAVTPSRPDQFGVVNFMTREGIPIASNLEGQAIQEILGNDPMTVGITKEYADKMFEDLAEMYPTRDVEKMQERFLRGEAIGAMTARHPFIGAYSAQGVKAKLVPGTGPYIVINELWKKVSANVGGEPFEKMMRFSAAVGAAGDTDADEYATWLTSPKLEPEVMSHIESQKYKQEWEAHQIRAQVMKAKEAGGLQATMRERMAGGYIKLGIPETELGALSNLLTSAKTALGMNSRLSDLERSQAAHILEWWEQTPISGKHIPDEQVVEMINLFSKAKAGMHSRNAGLLSQLTRRVMENKNVISAALAGGFEATIEEPSGSRKLFVGGLDLEKTFSNVMNSMKMMETNLTGAGVSAREIAETMTGKKAVTPKNVRSIFSSEVLAMNPFGEFIRSSKPGLMRGLIERAGAMKNRALAAGERMLPFAKPLGIGIGAAVGIATILSSPRESLSLEDRVPPRVDFRSGSGGANVDAGELQRSVEGSPTTSNPVYGANTARISSGYNVRARGRSREGIDYRSLGSNVSSVSQGNTSVSISDRRSSLTPQKLSDILGE